MTEASGNNYSRFAEAPWVLEWGPDGVSAITTHRCWVEPDETEYRRMHKLDCRHDNPFDSPSVQRTLGIARSGEPKYVYQDGEVRLLTAISSRCSYCGVLHGDDMRFCDRCGAPR